MALERSSCHFLFYLYESNSIRVVDYASGRKAIKAWLQFDFCSMICMGIRCEQQLLAWLVISFHSRIALEWMLLSLNCPPLLPAPTFNRWPTQPSEIDRMPIDASRDKSAYNTLNQSLQQAQDDSSCWTRLVTWLHLDLLFIYLIIGGS